MEEQRDDILVRGGAKRTNATGRIPTTGSSGGGGRGGNRATAIVRLGLGGGGGSAPWSVSRKSRRRQDERGESIARNWKEKNIP